MLAHRMKFPLIWFGVIAFSGIGYGVVKPEPSKDAGNALDYLKIEVNGQSRLLKNGGQLAVVRGDKVVIEKAVLLNTAGKVGSVNLVGFQSALAKQIGEDRGLAVDTGKDLVKRWSVDKNAERYVIRVASDKIQHGEAFLEILEPTLKYAVLKINGETAVLREQELVKVKASDQVKVEQVVTNVEDDTEKVRFQIVPAEVQGGPTGVKFYEIHFLRNEVIFARIPLQVEGS